MARNGYSTEFLGELKSKNDIVEVISKYMPLEQRGRNFWGRCPFHHEKTASFCINREEQFYHCFGCGKSGDVITFVMEFESVDFVDAVKILADRVKMVLPVFDYDSEKIQEAKKQKETLLSILSDTARFYYNNLTQNRAPDYLEYIYGRGFTKDIIKNFGLGASVDFVGLPTYLLDKGYKREDILSSGVCAEKNGKLYDFEGGRLIVPIINSYNQVIAFGGRVIVKTDFAKYKNTAETSVFIKNKVLFNINNLKKVKNEKGLKEVIMVEGYMDTIALASAGFENVVASMGTSLTKEQARLLKRYCDNVIISYDGDFAGQKATVRGLEILEGEGLNVKVVTLPDGLDPDDVIKKLGKEAYRKLLDGAKPLIDFKLDLLKRTYDITKTEEKRKYLSEAVAVIRTSPSKIEQEDLLKILSAQSGITFESLKRELESKKPSDKEIKEIESFPKEAGNKVLQAQRFILKSMLFNKIYTRNFDISSIRFTNPTHIAIADYISGERKAEKLCKVDVLYDILDDNDSAELGKICELGVDERPHDIEEKYFSDCVATLKREMLDEEIQSLKSLSKAETDIEKRNVILKKMLDKMAEKRRI